MRAEVTTFPFQKEKQFQFFLRVFKASAVRLDWVKDN